MRPRHLVLENFTSFRGRHEVDFTDLDLFVLSGPTGAGKSSILDAISCALYGSIPRYSDERLIEPAIHKLATQARVSFTFDVGAGRYVATRVLRRTAAGGAHAAEVRLERLRDDGSTAPLAAGSREVAEHVPRLLGLDFGEFCKTVVLPQGAFAQFLHGGREDRHKLLVNLLGLEVYRQVGEKARRRKQDLDARISAIDVQLAPLAEVDAAAVARADKRAAALAEARRAAREDLWPRLEAAREAVRSGEQAAQAAGDTVRALEALARPDGVAALAEAIRAADQAVADAEKDRARSRERWEAARAARDAAPDEHALSRLLDADRELDQTRTLLETLAGEAERAAAAVDAADAAARAAEKAWEDAAAAVEDIRRRHLAHTLAAGLEPGGNCPVCRQTVVEAPTHPDPSGLDTAEAAARAARTAAQERARQAAAARDRAAKISGRIDNGRDHEATLRAALAAATEAAGLPLVDGRADADAARTRITEAQKAAADARAAEDAARDADRRLKAAQDARRGLDEEARAAQETFGRVRDTVAHLGPPPARTDDLAGAWADLLAWRETRLDEAHADVRRRQEALAQARTERDRAAADILSTVTGAGVEPAGEDPQQAVEALGDAATRAGEEAARRREQLETAERLRADRATAAEQSEVAGLLGDLLRRDNFEQWLLNRLSTTLVAGASRILDELTQGAFALSLDPQRGAFEVIDHLNADERRPARTLSGGETFLASLALALSLAEHVAQVSRSGATRLDALFLDEGFGALDLETLDTVAAALEDLAGSRMVGIITHVRELAARIPVRFDVRRGPDGSTIRLAGPNDDAALHDLAEVAPR